MASQPPYPSNPSHPSSSLYPTPSQRRPDGTDGGRVSLPLTPLPPPQTPTPPAKRRLSHSASGMEPPRAPTGPAYNTGLPLPYRPSDSASMMSATTLIIPPPPAQPRHGFRLWPRRLSWRLIVIYTLLFAILLVALSVALNYTFSRSLYRSDFGLFQTQVVTTVASYKLRFDTLVCVDGRGYQQAFQEALVTPFNASKDVSGTYLLDSQGNLLAPDTSGNTVGASAPYLDQQQLERLRSSAFSGAHLKNRVAGSIGYMQTVNGQPVGVELVAIYYHTAPGPNPAKGCAGAAVAPGFVEVVTNFARVRLTLGALRLALLTVVVVIFLLGLVIGAPLTERALRPLSRVTRAARSVARGDLNQRVGLRQTDDEIGELAYTFDEMVERIQEMFAAQQASEDRMRQFIADASHELRTPLTSIRGYTDVLLRGAIDDPETAERVLLATRREAERMSRLVNDLITLARLDANSPLDMQPVDLIALTGEAVDQARILAGEREVAMRTDGGGRLMVTLDADRIKQVLLILLDNALKYGRQTPDGWVRVFVERTDHGALITIADNGQGIAPEDLPHIFERFYRAERAARRRRMTGSQVAARPEAPALDGAHNGREHGNSANTPPGGSGLGLAIAKAIVEAHGGTLSVQSRLGAGTTFTLALPLTPPQRRVTSAPAPASSHM